MSTDPFNGLEIKTRHLCDVTIDLDPKSASPATTGPFAMRSLVNIAGGRFEGKRISGNVHSGADFATIGNNETNTVALDVRSVWQADNGDFFYVTYYGRIYAPPQVVETFADPAQRPTMDPATYYWRVLPVFETSSEEFGWLNNITAVGLGRFTETGLVYRLNEVV